MTKATFPEEFIPAGVKFTGLPFDLRVPVKFTSPYTSNADAGLVLLMPTLPDVSEYKLFIARPFDNDIIVFVLLELPRSWGCLEKKFVFATFRSGTVLEEYASEFMIRDVSYNGDGVCSVHVTPSADT